MSVTIRDLSETLAGIRLVSKDLMECSRGPRVGGNEEAVIASVRGLQSHAEFLSRAAEELLQLIPNEPIAAPEK